MQYLFDVCIITFNRKDQLLVTLKNIIDELNGEGGIYVLDNGSTDGTREAILGSDIHKKIKYFNSDENRGVCRGRNILWRMAKSNIIISIDDDIIISRDSIIKMIEMLRLNPKIAVVSPLILDAATGRIQNPVGSQDVNNATNFFEACFVLKKNVISKIGYFDRNLKYAGEGYDYSVRLRSAGYSIKRAPNVRVLHYDRIRRSSQEAERRLAWVWSFTYVYFKNFGIGEAVVRTGKYCAGHLKSGLGPLGLRFAFSIPRNARAGMKAGLAERARIKKLLWRRQPIATQVEPFQN